MISSKTIDPCNISGLAPFQPTEEHPWNQQTIHHLLRRISFGISPTQLAEVQNMTPQEMVQALLTQAQNTPLADPLAWDHFTQEDYQTDNGVSELANQWRIQWVRSAINGSGINEKLMLFWHNHFVTQIQTYFCLPWMYEYHLIIHNNTFGNFKTFTQEMGITPAMLIYLNGVQNTVLAPNENYARELYELFTLGRDNGYTQEDITETARALTGYQGFNGICNPIDFVDISHDKGSKTIFGQTGNWGYEDVHDILFSERATQIANFICEKLYTHFVSPDLDYSITAELAQTFLDSDFELMPVYQQLFQSEHFFNAAVPGSVIKSPLDFVIGMMKETEVTVPDELILQAILASGGLLGQQLYSPVDVAGWPGDRTWIDTEKITLRWAISDLFLAAIFDANQEALRNLVKTISTSESDVTQVVTDLVNYFTPNGLYNQVDFDEALNTFKSDIPENYFEDGSWNLDWDTIPIQTGLFLSFLFKLPEFQLS